MNLKERIKKELQNPGFPNLKFLYSHKVLGIAQEFLEELLEEERYNFEKRLETKDENITFEIFQDFSLLDYFFSLLEHYQSVHNNEIIRNIIESFEPKYIEFWNEIAYSKRYYVMLHFCYNNCDCDWEQKRILEKSIKWYKVRGIDLAEEKQKRLKEISQKLSELSQNFSNNILDSQKEFEYVLNNEEIISEMPSDDKEVARERAKKKDVEWYLFDASVWAYISIMKYCSDSSVRKEFYEARQSFGSVWKFDNRENILEILALRNEKAVILGYKNYAELSLEFKMAESSDQIIELFSDISQRAKPKALEEISEIQEYFEVDSIDEWDLSYFARRLKEEKYSLDERKLKEYFEFTAVKKWMFDIMQKLYGIEMNLLEIDTYGDDVDVYEIYREWEFLSYFMTDYFYDPLKRPGAWANILRENSPPTPLQEKGAKKLVINVWNFQKGVDGVTLLTLSDVETMFHELGHGIHEMLSKSKYSELSGFHVEWDFVELPSQLLENWCRDESGMNLFAKHYKTGEAIPGEILETLKKLETFGSWSFVMRQNTFAMLDMDLHTQALPKNNFELDERVKVIQEQNAFLPSPETYTPHTSFSHIFDGWYAAGYYSYMWAEIIEKEVWKVFKDSWDIFSPEISTKFHDTILSAGTTKKASELFRDFLWRDPKIDAFLEEKGLVNLLF